MSDQTVAVPMAQSASGQFLGRATLRRTAIVLIGLTAALLFGPIKLGGDYLTFIVAAIAYNSIAVLTLSLLAGYSGIWSMTQPAFVALGAYVTANMASAGLPLELVLPIIVVGTGLVGFMLGTTAGRFSILYFGLLTLAVSLTATEIIGRWSSVTGGDEGLGVMPLKSLIAGRELSIDDGAVLSIILATCVFLTYDFIVKGTIGRRWLAVKSQRTAAMGVGLVPQYQNAFAFAVSAALSSTAGTCIAVSIGYLEPGAFSLDAGVMMIVATVVGGVGSFLGAVVGAAFLVGVPELGRAFSDFSAFVFGATVIVVLLFLPRGIVPSVIDFSGRLLHKSVPSSVAATAKPSFSTEITTLASDLMSNSTGPLVIDKLSVAFGGLKALQNVSFSVEPGETIGLIGPNGAGKTTVLNALSGYITVAPETTLLVGGSELCGKQPWQRRQAGLSRTFQHAELFGELSVRDNLIVAADSAVGREWTPEEVANRIITSLRLQDVADKKPSELPFGMQKVTDIGRVLATGAPLVALDEPFSGLDTKEVQDLRDILQGMREAGVSILLIDHAVQEVLDIADRVIVLNFGEILATGSPDEIRNDPRVLEAYFGAAVQDKDRVARNFEGGTSAIDMQAIVHRYGGVLAVNNVNLGLPSGSFSALLGPNGAGKSTLSLIMSCVYQPSKGVVKIDNAIARPKHSAHSGVTLIPEGRRLFGQLSIRENFLLGGFGAGKSDAQSRDRMIQVLELMPTSVQESLDREAATLSGGERQMVALGRALMADPKVLIVDEPSMGLAPILIKRFYEILEQLNRNGVTILVVEQLATHALESADYIVVMHRGAIAYAGPATGEAAEQALREGFIGDRHDEAGGSADV